MNKELIPADAPLDLRGGRLRTCRETLDARGMNSQDLTI